MRKCLKRVVSLMIAFVFVFSVGITAFADLQENEKGKISYEGLCDWLKDGNVNFTEWSKSNFNEKNAAYNADGCITRQHVVDWLTAHGDLYLGTVYKGGDYQSPKGEPSYNGYPGMNCGGFVSHVMRCLGMRGESFWETLDPIKYRVLFGSGLPYDLCAGASNWISMAHFHKWKTYVYNTKEELLADGKAQKGDIIVSYWSLMPGHQGKDNHIGFFWGDNPQDDKFWHSSTHPQTDGNAITPLTPKSNGSLWVLIPLGDVITTTRTPGIPPSPKPKPDPSPEPDKPYVYIRKTSDDGKVAGITFTITGGGKTYHRTTDENGMIDCSDLPMYVTDGTGNPDKRQLIEYHVEEEIPVRYIHDGENASKNFVLEPGKTVYLDFENKVKKWRLTFKKHDVDLGTQAQGKGTLFGAEFGIYHNGELIDVVMSNYDGVVVTNWYPCDSGYTMQEILAPDGYVLDPTIYSIGLLPSETVEEYNECNRLEPLDEDDPDVIRMKYQIANKITNGISSVTKSWISL